MPQPLKTFIIYAREDRDALLELKKQLIPLERRGQIAIWYDGEIVAGQEWGAAIKTNLGAADIILLLLSSDFFASEYIEKKELREALARHENGRSTVVPVVVRHCIWQEHPEIEKLQVLPEGAAPVFSKRYWDSPDEALANVAQGVARIAKARQETVLPLVTVAAPPPPGLPDMVFVKGGTFTMGTPKNEADRNNNETQHQVTLSDFAIGKYAVTQQLWQDIMGNNPSGFKGDDLPVEQVSWGDVQDFLQKLNARYPDQRYRLPTEAEWEYAARGGNQSKGFIYAGGNNLDEVGWYWKNSGDTPLSGDWDASKITKNNGRTHPVGLKRANELGLYDMSGNVWEWCADWFDAYPSGQQTNPRGPETGTYRVRRGGSWGNGFPLDCRVACRSAWPPNARFYFVGFRLASSPQ